MQKYIVTMDCEKGDEWTRHMGESTSLEEMMHLFENCPVQYTPGVIIRVIMTRVVVEDDGDITSSEFIKIKKFDFSYDSDEDDLD
jgi:hypothetical protein